MAKALVVTLKSIQNPITSPLQGLLKQLLILPGMDAASIACPASDPRIPDVSRVPPIGDVPQGKVWGNKLAIMHSDELQEMKKITQDGWKAIQSDTMVTNVFRPF